LKSLRVQYQKEVLFLDLPDRSQRRGKLHQEDREKKRRILPQSYNKFYRKGQRKVQNKALEKLFRLVINIVQSGEPNLFVKPRFF